MHLSAAFSLSSIGHEPSLVSTRTSKKTTIITEAYQKAPSAQAHLYKDRIFLVRFVSVASLSLRRLLEPTFMILAKSRSTRLSLTGFLENFSAQRGSLKHAVSITTPSFPSDVKSSVSITSWISSLPTTSLLDLLSFKSLPLDFPSSFGFCNGGSLGTCCHCCCCWPPTPCC